MPKLARFTARDPLLQNGAALLRGVPKHAYGYAANNPANRLDPSGKLTQVTARIPITPPEIEGGLYLTLLWLGRCGAYAWTTEWIPQVGEEDGLIVQFVNDSQYTDAGKPLACIRGDKAIPRSQGMPGKNTLNCSPYIEIWRVKGGQIFADKVFDEVPANPQPGDMFGHPGFENPTKGKMSKKGFAFFVPAKKVNAALLQRLKQLFGTGPSGAAGTGNLTSACATPAVNTLYGALKKQSTTKSTSKEAIVEWNCCCEGVPDKNNLKIKLDDEDALLQGPKQECTC